MPEDTRKVSTIPTGINQVQYGQTMDGVAGANLGRVGVAPGSTPDDNGETEPTELKAGDVVEIEAYADTGEKPRVSEIREFATIAPDADAGEDYSGWGHVQLAEEVAKRQLVVEASDEEVGVTDEDLRDALIDSDEGKAEKVAGADYDKMTVAELRDAAAARGIDVKRKNGEGEPLKKDYVRALRLGDTQGRAAAEGRE